MLEKEQQGLGQVALIGKHLPPRRGSQGLKWLAISSIARCHLEGHGLILLAEEEVELEAEEPAHGGVTTPGQPSEEPVAAAAPVVIDHQLDALGKVLPVFRLLK